MELYRTMDEAVEALEAAFADVAADFPEVVGAEGEDMDVVAYDVVNSVVQFCSPAVGAELKRCYL